MKRPRCWRKGSRSAVAAYDEAVRALWANPDREETDRYLRLNSRVNALSPTLSPYQRSVWATGARLDRADSREERARRAARKGRGRSQ